MKLMLKQCLAITRREFYYMWRDKGLRYILLLASLIGLLLFAGIYSAQVLQDIPTAVVDLDKSSQSRALVQKLENAENLKVTARLSNYAEARELLEEGRAVVGVVIPENFGHDVSLSRSTNVAMLIDGSNMVYATNASSAVLTITRTVSAEAGVKTLLAQGVELNQAKEAYQAIDLKEEYWFNPTANYAYFLVLGLVLNMWQQCCTLAACANIISETGVSSWLQIRAMGISKFKLFFSKSIAHLIVFMVLAVVLYVLCFGVLKLPLHCGWGILLLFTFAAALALHSVGTMMSSLALNAVDSARFGMIVALPSFVLSGFTWPLEAMPHFLQLLVWILPQTWFFQGLNYLTFKNPGWHFMLPYFKGLIIITLVCYGVSTVATGLIER